ncbi:MAG: hypothetical protein ACK4I0_00080 [Brevundimonas sp.]|uniref:hypothetical protein n=1 Tax=Brevundimonas sp. TaxID=1871086 RepID=UPI00391972FB
MIARLPVLFLVAWLAGCGQQGQLSNLPENAIVVNADINQDTFDNYKREFSRTGSRDLVISSRGGNNSVALEWARFIVDNRIRVTARTFCASACASHLWIASADRGVFGPTFLGFHTTSESNRIMIDLTPSVPTAHDVLDRAEGERSLYQSVGVSYDLLVDPAWHLQPVCGQIGEDGKFGFVSKFGLWAATPDQLASYKVSYRGSLPATREEAEQILADITRSGSVSFAFGGDASPLEELPNCNTLPMIVAP